ILGVGVAGAAVALNAWPPDPEPVVRAMHLALEDAGVPPDAIDVVFASANSTRVVDEVEAQALLELLPSGTAVTSIKGALGECGAAGAASLVAALLCAREGLVPPVADLVEPDGRCARRTRGQSAAALPGPRILVNSIGSGGSLVSAVVRAGTPEMR